MSKISRLQVDIFKHQLDELERLRKLGGLRSKRELWDVAFTLLKWATRKKDEGVAIGSLNADGIFKELEMPFLEDYACSVRKELLEKKGSDSTPTTERVNGPEVVVATSNGRNGGSNNIHLAKRKRTA